MRHLSPERLAAVADERPSPDEAAHLAQCGQCADGREAHRRLIAGAALERDRTIAPLSSWGAISAQLRAEGIIRTPDTATPSASMSSAAPVIPFTRPNADDIAAASKPVSVPATPEVATPVLPMRRRVVPAWALQVAAGLALLVGGALVGRATSTSQQVARVEDVKPPLQSSTPPTGFVAPVASVTQSEEYFHSTREAQEAMVRAEKTYRAAIQYLAANDSTLRPPIPDPVEAYRSRLAALDDAVAETRKALKLAPTSQALNDYYLTSVNARETTLRQIDDALPVDQRVTRF